ncbi:MAG: hypothetical protein H8K03_14530 [Nitrospira sp.]|nr:hypothetical protein [Nitrospira sp. BO4]
MRPEDDEESDERKVVRLLEVAEEDDVLELEDGRRLVVAPGNIPTASLWLPTATLEITETGEDVFDLLVQLQGATRAVRARWDNLKEIL